MKKHVTLFSSVLMMSTTLLGAGGVLAEEANPKTADTPISAELEINQTPEKPVLPTDPDGGGDKPTDITGLFGIAYTPNTLSGHKVLGESGREEVDLANNRTTKYNVGVQDKTRKNNQQWTLKARLEWSNDNNNYMAGTTITATGGNVKENKKGTLTELTSGEVITEASTLTVNQGSEVEVMKSVSGKTMNGVYNYQFESPKLVIPEVSKVTAGSYSGNIKWNLENTPGI
ncbi:TPA: WxL domain-containing protein [Enterococcus faecium]|uniref:WxL domain-containing protein n=1 Tax=Enterococcus faecium TaxID=1352 RepID=UPI001F3AE469|nr:WxL domain-containing protein [Enterococcus faecium]MDN3045551.1 WxL domain-containing protein [Enterococcus faecium]MDQ8260211.1 WxL domain-containing protein [Enterococcus faecium]MDQ8277354.1 WxL domain-containing protein [Enterococcus faecium]